MYSTFEKNHTLCFSKFRTMHNGCIYFAFKYYHKNNQFRLFLSFARGWVFMSPLKALNACKCVQRALRTSNWYVLIWSVPYFYLALKALSKIDAVCILTNLPHKNGFVYLIGDIGAAFKHQTRTELPPDRCGVWQYALRYKHQWTNQMCFIWEVLGNVCLPAVSQFSSELVWTDRDLPIEPPIKRIQSISFVN